MSTDGQKRIKEIVRHVRRLPDWDVVHGRHVKFLHHGRTVVVAPTSPSDPRTVKNLTAELRRKGVEL